MDLIERMFELDASEIKLKERFRGEMGEVEELLESIKTFGQLQPVIVNRNYELIAGGRRVAACMLGQIKVLCIFKDVLEPLEMREIELEENLRRKDFTPAEEVLAIDEIHRLKSAAHPDWNQTKTGAIVGGRTKQSISDDIGLATLVKSFPSLKECKTKNEIRKAAKGLTKLTEKLIAVKNYEEKVKEQQSLFDVRKADAVEDMMKIPSGSINLLLTDPPYGIDIDKNMIGIGGKTGGESAAGFKYEDTEDEAERLLGILARESFRFCTEDAHAFVFTSPKMFWRCVEVFRENEWLVSDRPIVWIKRSTGQNNAPQCWFSSAYEFIMYARKLNSRLVIEGKPDWIQCDPTLESEKHHQSQKPLPLLHELIKRSTLPGKTLYDPFMGSGSAIVAALDCKLIPSGCDILEESYASTMFQIQEWIKNHTYKGEIQR